MAEHRSTCAICDEPIQFGYHCECCVWEHWVCRCCEKSIQGKQETATTCGATCKKRAQRGYAEFGREATWIYETKRLSTEMSPRPLVGGTGGTNEGTEGYLIAIIERLDKLIQVAQAPTVTRSISVTERLTDDVGQALSKPKPVEFDLGSMEVTIAKKNDKINPTFNMLLSGLGIGTAKLEDLPAEVIQYGIETNRIRVEDVPWFNGVTKEKTESKSNPKAMDVPQFETPDFEDLQL